MRNINHREARAARRGEYVRATYYAAHAARRWGVRVMAQPWCGRPYNLLGRVSG